MDKVNTNNDLEEVERQHQQLKSKNQRESHVLDDIFGQRQQCVFESSHRKSKESVLKDVEKQIEAERLKAEAQIEELVGIKTTHKEGHREAETV